MQKIALVAANENTQHGQLAFDDLVADIFVKKGIDEETQNALCIAQDLKQEYKNRESTYIEKLQAQYGSAKIILQPLTPLQKEDVFSIFVRHQFYLQLMYRMYSKSTHTQIEESILKQRIEAEKKGTLHVHYNVVQLAPPRVQKQ